MFYFLNWFYGTHNLTDLSVSKKAFENVIADLQNEFDIHVAVCDDWDFYSIINYYGDRDIIGKIYKGGGPS